MEKQNIARFPRPVYNRISNFVGAEKAAAKLRSMALYEEAKVLKVAPDFSLRAVREMALTDGKEIVMPVPRLRSRQGFLLLNPDVLKGSEYKRVSTIKGAFKSGESIHPSGLPEIDLVICGAVAVSENGVRIGKGSGYGEFEFAILREFKKVNGNTQGIAIVHDIQIVSEELFPERYDLTVDYIVTPTRIIKTRNRFSKPKGLIWEKISRDRLREIPLLQELKSLS